MLFNSLQYYIFLGFVIPLYFSLKHYPQAQRWWLFLVSLYFYAVFHFTYILLLLYSIAVSYYTILAIDRAGSKNRKKIYATAGILGNLLLLLVFKYNTQFYDILNFVLGRDPCKETYIALPPLLLPMGISFFTLQAISSIVDFYRGTAEKPKSVWHYGLYLSFFPQLVAGPILRTRDLLRQLYEPKTFQMENFRKGLFLLSLGYYKKTFIADSISPYVDEVFASPWEYHSISLWIAVYLFSIQIYGDFSGYSDIAVGTARILGFHLPENFRRPFFSTTMGEFWRRWHISFSSWLRDYVYIPLGGSRVSVPRMYWNLFLTMVVSGIWHGAGWNYLLWGAIHGFVLLTERMLISVTFIRNALGNIPGVLRTVAGVFYTFTVFSVTFFFFRAKPLVFPGDGILYSAVETGTYMFLRAWIPSPGKILLPPIPVLVLASLLFLYEFLEERNLFEEERKKFENSVLLYYFAGIILFVALVIYSVSTSQPFVYFQF